MNILVIFLSWIFYPPLFYYKCKEKGLSFFPRFILTLLSPLNLLLVLNIIILYEVLIPAFMMLLHLNCPGTA